MPSLRSVSLPVSGACTALLFLFAFACSSTTVEKGAPSGATPDAGTAAPQTPADVPAVALEANPETDCPAAYRAKAPAAGTNGGYEIAGQQREFALLLPGDTSTPRPVLVAFNGTGEDGPSFVDRAKLEDFAAKGFVVIAPSSAGNGSTWPVWDSLRQPGTESDPNKDLDYFDSLLKCVAAHHPLDKNRLYVTGHSAGGIMTNNVLQRRSELLAGGIVASGVFSLTSPVPAKPLSPLFVVVTWGGDNDKYSGSAGAVKVGGFNFVSEASLASKFYDAEPAVGEVNCRGNDLGHAWLSTLNGWFVEQLLAHPKGLSGKGSAELAPPVPAGAKAVCTDAPYAGPEGVEVSCQPSTRAGCQEACQLFGDCAVENGTVGPALAKELTAIGFSGPSNANCGGCVTSCETTATGAGDAAVLTCFQQKQAAAKCEQGINGAYPLIKAVNECCTTKDSAFCAKVCTEVMKNSSAASFFSTCASYGK